MAHADFVHLRVHTTYSLAEGALKINELASLCKENIMPAVAITDTGNLFGSLEFSLACANQGIQPIIGCHLGIQVLTNNNQHESDVVDRILLLAKDETGYQHLMKLSSIAYLQHPDCSTPFVTLDELSRYSEGLIAFQGHLDSTVARILLNNQYDVGKQLLLQFKDIFDDRLYIELMRHGTQAEAILEPLLLELAHKEDIPLVATNDVFFGNPDMFEAHDALRCIAEGRYVLEDDRPRLTAEHYFKSAEQMKERFADLPEAIANTLVIAQRCAVMSHTRAPLLPHFPTSNGRSEAEELRHLASEGLTQRLTQYVFDETMDEAQRSEIAKPYLERLEFELDTIINMKFPGYFLIVSDFIKWSKQQGIPVGPGRGSGAGSVVAWSLLITDLDPLRFGLLFERFLNPERISMPDFDIDFCQERRDEVISYVQQKYGHDHVAQIITFGKLQARAVLRDVGRVLQMPYGQVDTICKMVPNNPAQPTTLAEAIELEPQLRIARDDDEHVAHLLNIGLQLEGLNRHASTHAAGVVIADRPLDELVPLYRDPRSEMPVVQYSMKYAELAGLVKFDFLGLKTLTVIDHACKLIRKQGNDIDINHIPFNDPPTYNMLSQGNSIGVFQLESAGMRDTLRKLRPDTLEDIIALISLYRPGPMDNIPSYIARKHGNEQPDYLHPMLESVLKETFGVIIYQEQVMQIAQILAGYTLGDADLLRRAMGKKIKSEMDKQQKRFVEGSIANKVDKNQASMIFDLVAKFAGYGFNKSHAAAYALISYQTAYLKANYPVEFLVASMNLDIGDTDKLHIFIQDAKRLNIPILSPDINHSLAEFSVDYTQEQPAIRYGLAALKGVGFAAMEEMVDERTNNHYSDIFDFAKRNNSKTMNKRQLESLTKAGSFDPIHTNRKQLIENIDILTRLSSLAAEERNSNQLSLFDHSDQPAMSNPNLTMVTDWNNIDRIQQSYEVMGFYLDAHPLDEYVPTLSKAGVTQASAINNVTKEGVSFIKLAGIVISHKKRVSQRGRFAYLQLSDPSGSYEVAVFDEQLLEQHASELETGKTVILTTEARKDDGSLRLIANRIYDLERYLVEQIKAPHFMVHMQSTEALAHLKEICKTCGPGKSQLHIKLSTDAKGEVHITLPDQYNILPRHVVDIRQIADIQEMEEA